MFPPSAEFTEIFFFVCYALQFAQTIKERCERFFDDTELCKLLSFYVRSFVLNFCYLFQM